MATYSNFQLTYGLRATATPANAKTTGSLSVGQVPTVESLDGNFAAAYTIISATTGGQALWTPSAGTVAAVGTGTTVQGISGADAEGTTFPSIGGVCGYLWTSATTANGDIAWASTVEKIHSVSCGGGIKFMQWLTDGSLDSTGTVTITFTKPGDAATLVAIYAT
jgi:hypothetical protein